MAYTTINELFKGICNTIREKTNEVGNIAHQDIPNRINNIVTSTDNDSGMECSIISYARSCNAPIVYIPIKSKDFVYNKYEPLYLFGSVDLGISNYGNFRADFRHYANVSSTSEYSSPYDDDLATAGISISTMLVNNIDKVELKVSVSGGINRRITSYNLNAVAIYDTLSTIKMNSIY